MTHRIRLSYARAAFVTHVIVFDPRGAPMPQSRPFASGPSGTALCSRFVATLVHRFGAGQETVIREQVCGDVVKIDDLREIPGRRSAWSVASRWHVA
jgi:hypothetical protein